MIEYPKIDSIFKRDQAGRFTHEYARPEFRYLKDNCWIGTEKVDGTNIRVMFDPKAELPLRFGGKTNNAQIPSLLIDRLRVLFSEDAFRDFPDGVTLYGEGYGAKIQKGGGNYKPDGVDFVLFDVRIGEWWLERPDINDIALKLGISSVPVVFEGTLSEAVEFVKEGFISSWHTDTTRAHFDAEGLVLMTAVALLCRNGSRVITKIKTKDFRK